MRTISSSGRDNTDCSLSGLAGSPGIKLAIYFLTLSRGLYILNPFGRILQRGFPNHGDVCVISQSFPSP